MKPIKHNFLSVIVFWKKNCKFSHSCTSFSNLNFTCTNKGGNYCGLYREYKQETNPTKQNNKQNTHPEMLPNPSLYEPTTVEIENHE